jgi:hypothetical protein
MAAIPGGLSLTPPQEWNIRNHKKNVKYFCRTASFHLFEQEKEMHLNNPFCMNFIAILKNF